MQPGGMSGGPHAQQQPGRGRGRGRGRFGAEQPGPPAAPTQSHADVVAALKQQQEPLTIGGGRSGGGFCCRGCPGQQWQIKTYMKPFVSCFLCQQCYSAHMVVQQGGLPN